MRRINGVRAIAEEIEVRYPFEKKIADDEIAKRALDILDWDSTVPARAIQVLVRNGWVTLTGDVDWYFQTQAAEDDIRKLSGIHGIINNIAIKPCAQAEDVRMKIEDALRRRLKGEVNGIRVTVQDGARIARRACVQPPGGGSKIS